MREIAARSALSLALALAAPASPAQVAAQILAPDVLLRSVTRDVTSRITFDMGTPAGDPARVAAMVETKVSPLFDFNRMTQSAMARNWSLASPAQQAALIAEFKTLLVRAYSSALSTYYDQAIEFKPVHLAPGDTDVTVKTDMKQPGRERLSINYEMEKMPAGWKVYDVKVAGVSLVTNYRETFAETVRDRGVDGLIKSLADKNRQSYAPPGPHPSIREIALLIMSAAQGILPGGK